MTADQRILHVGCGFGRNMRWLSDEGSRVIGVDINPNLVDAARDADRECLTVEELEARDDCFDMLLMAHIIEHFAPQDLLRFLDAYLGRLHVGGHLCGRMNGWIGLFRKTAAVAPASLAPVPTPTGVSAHRRAA